MTSERVDAGLNSVVLHLLPMFHVFGLMVTLANVARGSTVVMLPRFDFLAMLEAIQKYRITAAPLVPPILLLMIKQDVVMKYDMSSLQNIGCGAAPLGEDLLARCAQRFPNAKLLQVNCTKFSCYCFLSIFSSLIVTSLSRVENMNNGESEPLCCTKILAWIQE